MSLWNLGIKSPIWRMRASHGAVELSFAVKEFKNFAVKELSFARGGINFCREEIKFCRQKKLSFPVKN